MNIVMMETQSNMMDVMIVNFNVNLNAQSVLKESVMNVQLKDGT